MDEALKKLKKSQKVCCVIGLAMFAAAVVAEIVLWFTVGREYRSYYYVIAFFVALPILFFISSALIGFGDVFGIFKWLLLLIPMALPPVLRLFLTEMDLMDGMVSVLCALFGMVAGFVWLVYYREALKPKHYKK